MKVCFVVTLCLVEAFTFTAHNKAALIGFAYKTIKDVDWFSCIVTCQEDLSYISYNFCVAEHRHYIDTHHYIHIIDYKKVDQSRVFSLSI